MKVNLGDEGDSEAAAAVPAAEGLDIAMLEPPPPGQRRLPTDLEFFAHDFLHAPRGDFILQENRRDLFLDHLRDWLAEKWEVAIFCNNEGEQKRLQEILAEAQIAVDAITFLLRPLLRGFVWPAGKIGRPERRRDFWALSNLARVAAAGTTGEPPQPAPGARLHRNRRGRLRGASSSRHRAL